MIARLGGWLVFRIQIETTVHTVYPVADKLEATKGSVIEVRRQVEQLVKCSGRFAALVFPLNRLAAMLTCVADAIVDDKALRARRRARLWWSWRW